MADLNDIHTAIGGLTAEVKAMRHDLERTEARHERRMNDHGEKIDSLQQSRARYRGALGVLAIVASVPGVNKLLELFHG